MRVTISKFRQDLFRLVDRVIQGETVEFTHKGVLVRVLAEPKRSKLERVTGEPTLAADFDFQQAGRELLKEMETEWERDWSEL